MASSSSAGSSHNFTARHDTLNVVNPLRLFNPDFHGPDNNQTSDGCRV
jgi:hypothetical protein